MPRIANTPEFWNATAQKYAAWTISDMGGYEATLRRTSELLFPDARVLELGCGTGTTALRLATHVATLDASDFSPAMIAIAREKLDAAGTPNLRFSVATSGPLPVESGSRDAVLAFNLLHLLDQRQAMLADILRVLKPGGLFISKTPCIAELNILIRLAIPFAQMIRKAPYIESFTAGALAAEIEAAGFHVIEQGRHGTGKSDPRIFLVARKPD